MTLVTKWVTDYQTGGNKKDCHQSFPNLVIFWWNITPTNPERPFLLSNPPLYKSRKLENLRPKWLKWWSSLQRLVLPEGHLLQVPKKLLVCPAVLVERPYFDTPNHNGPNCWMAIASSLDPFLERNHRPSHFTQIRLLQSGKRSVKKANYKGGLAYEFADGPSGRVSTLSQLQRGSNYWPWAWLLVSFGREAARFGPSNHQTGISRFGGRPGTRVQGRTVWHRWWWCACRRAVGSKGKLD